MTFDLKVDSKIDGHTWESFAVCRECMRPTIFKLGTPGPPCDPGTFSRNVRLLGHVSVADRDARPSPEYVPDPIAAAFQEGAKCLAIGCFNAAAAMFRLVLDIATRGLLPSDDAAPDKRTRYLLAPRLEWLFENEKLPEGLRDLASVVKDDGNDGAHQGTVDAETAEDLVDFTERLLTQIYTEPAKIKIAKERSAERKKRGK